MKTRKPILTVLAVLWMSLLASCVVPGNTQSFAPNTSLMDTEWVLISMDGTAPIEAKDITLRFGETELKGSAGCNTYGATYTASEESLTVSDIYRTEMACPEPEGILDQENTYFETLDKATTYLIEDDRLSVYDEGGVKILVYITIPSVQPLLEATPNVISMECNLDMDETYAANGPVDLTFALHNPTDRTLYVLSWYTPLEGMAGDILQVTHEGANLSYEGMLAKRGDPTRDDYIAIAPGETVSAEVDVRTGYDLSAPGSYQVEFIMGLQDVVTDESQIPQKREDHQPQPLMCNPVNFSIETMSEAPAGFRRYVNGATGVSLWVPADWTIIESGMNAPILQSYPQDKYVGGEPRQPGDTKCDLFIHPSDITIADVLPREDTQPPTTILSEQEITLQSGALARRYELDNLGRFLSLITEVNGHVVVFSCFGETEQFDNIAVTLGASE